MVGDDDRIVTPGRGELAIELVDPRPLQMLAIGKLRYTARLCVKTVERLNRAERDVIGSRRVTHLRYQCQKDLFRFRRISRSKEGLRDEQPVLSPRPTRRRHPRRMHLEGVDRKIEIFAVEPA